MLEKLLTGPKTYYLWLLFLLAVIAGCGLSTCSSCRKASPSPA